MDISYTVFPARRYILACFVCFLTLSGQQLSQPNQADGAAKRVVDRLFGSLQREDGVGFKSADLYRDAIKRTYHLDLQEERAVDNAVEQLRTLYQELKAKRNSIAQNRNLSGEARRTAFGSLNAERDEKLTSIAAVLAPGLRQRTILMLMR
jgi:hypothetical protein